MKNLVLKNSYLKRLLLVMMKSMRITPNSQQAEEVRMRQLNLWRTMKEMYTIKSLVIIKRMM